MKHTMICLAAAATLLCACGNSTTREIERAAQGYLDAMGNYHIEEAVPFASRQTVEITLPSLSQLMAMADTSYINSNRPATITLHNTKMLNDSTARVYYHKSTPIKEVDDSVTVIRENSRWLVEVKIRPLPLQNIRTIRDGGPQIKGDSVLIEGKYTAMKDIKAIPIKK